MDKKGFEKNYVIIALILGIILLGMVFMMIFPEIFGDESDWETCRASIIARNSVPNYGIIEDAKDLLPLKCKTEVINIDYKDVERAEKEIADTMAACWYLYGEGRYSVFPPNKIFSDKHCVPCARIHFNEEVKEFYKWSSSTPGIDDMDVLAYLANTKYRNTGKTYSEYFWSFMPYGAVGSPEGLKLPDGDNNLGIRGYIDPEHETIISVYFYSGSRLGEILAKLPLIEETGFFSVLFYYQPGKDSPECEFEGIPA